MKFRYYCLLLNLFISVISIISISLYVKPNELELFFKAVTYSIFFSMLIYPSIEHYLASVQTEETEETEETHDTIRNIKNIFLLLQIIMIFISITLSQNVYILALLCSIGELSLRINLIREEFKKILVINLITLAIYILLLIIYKFDISILHQILIFYSLRGILLCLTKKIEIKLNEIKYLFDFRKFNYTLSNSINAIIGILFINMLYINTPYNIANSFAFAQRIFGTLIGVYSIWIFPISIRLLNNNNILKLKKLYINYHLITLTIIIISILLYSITPEFCYKNICLNIGIIMSIIINLLLIPTVTIRVIESRFNKEKKRLIFNIIFMLIFLTISHMVIPILNIYSVYILFLCNVTFNVGLAIFYYINLNGEK